VVFEARHSIAWGAMSDGVQSYFYSFLKYMELIEYALPPIYQSVFGKTDILLKMEVMYAIKERSYRFISFNILYSR
jgi:hypothetical protein